jgi:hypothetical protein
MTVGVGADSGSGGSCDPYGWGISSGLGGIRCYVCSLVWSPWCQGGLREIMLTSNGVKYHGEVTH